MTTTPAVLRSMIDNKDAASSKITVSSDDKFEVVKGEMEEDKVIIIRTTESKLAEAERKVLDIQNLNAVPRSLRNLDTAAGVFQFFQGLILFLLATKSRNMRTLYTNYPNPIDPLEPLPNEIAEFSVLWYAPIICITAGIQHVSTLLFNNTYIYYLSRHQNPIRWAEYTFSASLVRVMLAQVVGVLDVHILLSIFIMSAMCQQCGSLHESMNAKARADGLQNQNWRAFWVGCILHGVSWVIILCYFNDTVKSGIENPLVWTIVIIVFLLELSFAIVFALQWLKIGMFEDYIAGEHAFVILSLTSKSLLAWVTFGMN